MTAKGVHSTFDLLRAIGVPDRDTAMYSSASLKNPTYNMQFRRMCVEMGYENQSVAEQLWILCARDPLFFINTFCWLLEAREGQEWNLSKRYGSSKEIPFISRGYQDNLILNVMEHLGKKDISVPKSRETGISWIMVALTAWDWTFHDQTHIGYVSKDLLSANNPDDPDALFSKFQFLIERLPYWMLSPSDWERNISKNTFKNTKNGSSLTAYPANADLGRGGRKSWMLMDEFHFFKPGEDYAALDSTVHVTPCRVFVSTANRARGMAGAFYDVVSDPTRNGVIITVDWKDDPEKRKGLYHSELIPGMDTYRLILDDMEFWLPFANHDKDKTFRHPLHETAQSGSKSKQSEETYPFILDGRWRSLYYDHVWNRPGSTPQSVAAELDRNFGGATAQIFDPQILAIAVSQAKPSVMSGDLVRNPDNERDWMFQKLARGGLTTMWIHFDKEPPKGEYVFGADISAGTGGAWSSYSALEGLNKATGEQVFEWRGNKLDPIQFGELAVWVCRWFHDAYLVPEVNGPLGTLFINKVTQDLQYPYVYRATRHSVSYKERTNVVGYRNQDKGIELLKHMEATLRRGRVKLHSKIALDEVSRYFMKNGKLVHSAAETTEDGAGMGLAHGDAAIALGCAAFGIDDIPIIPEAKIVTGAPVGSFLQRRQEYERQMNQKQNRSYWQEKY